MFILLVLFVTLNTSRHNMYKTFNGWKQQGRIVDRGQRGDFRNEYGDMMFHESKTVPRGPVERITVYRDTFGRFIKKTVQYN